MSAYHSSERLFISISTKCTPFGQVVLLVPKCIFKRIYPCVCVCVCAVCVCVQTRLMMFSSWGSYTTTGALTVKGKLRTPPTPPPTPSATPRLTPTCCRATAAARKQIVLCPYSECTKAAEKLCTWHIRASDQVCKYIYVLLLQAKYYALQILPHRPTNQFLEFVFRQFAILRLVRLVQYLCS